MVIGFAAIGAAIIEQQLNMAAAAFAKGGTDLEKILGQVQLLPVDHRLRHPDLADEPHPPATSASASRC